MGTVPRGAIVLVASYVLLAIAYLASGRWLDPHPHARWVRDVAFVIAAGAGLLLATSVLIRRTARLEAARARTEAALHVAEQRAVGGVLAATVAHDFANAITTILGYAELLQRSTTLGQEEARAVEAIRAAAERAARTGARIARTGLRDSHLQRRQVSLFATATKLLEELQKHPRLRGVETRLATDGSPRGVAYPYVLEHLIAVLVLRAAEALEGQGAIEVRVGGQGTTASIEVHDSGSESGNGVGTDDLAIVSARACASLHGGRVIVDRSSLGGAAVRVELALEEPTVSPADR